MSSSRSDPAYLSTICPFAMNTNAGTDSTPHSLQMSLQSSLASMAMRALEELKRKYAVSLIARTKVKRNSK